MLNLCHPRWYIWFLPLWMEMARAVSKGIVEFSKTFPFLGTAIGLGWVYFIIKLII